MNYVKLVEKANKKYFSTIVSYQIESFSSKWELPSLLPPSIIIRGRMEAIKAALILMKNSHFDRTPHYLTYCHPWDCHARIQFHCIVSMEYDIHWVWRAKSNKGSNILVWIRAPLGSKAYEHTRETTQLDGLQGLFKENWHHNWKLP